MRILSALLISAITLVSCAVAPVSNAEISTAIEAKLITNDEFGRFRVDLQNPFHAFESIVNKPKIYFIPIVLGGSISMNDTVVLDSVSLERGESSESAQIWFGTT